MTLCEKIIAAHAVVDAKVGAARRAGRRSPATRCSSAPTCASATSTSRPWPRRSFKPGHRARRRERVGARERVRLPRSPDLPRHRSCPKAHIKMGLREQAHEPRHRAGERSPRASGREALRRGAPRRQAAWAPRRICHNKVIEDIALPGQLVDRHRLAHVHGGLARLLRLRRRLDRHGQRVVHARHPGEACPRPFASC